jgi:hypothetical protein
MLGFLKRERSSPSTRQRWLLVYNCQVMGLGNCLNLLSDRIDVTHYDPASFRKQSADLLKRIGEYDRVLVAPQLETDLGIDEQRCAELWRVPTISFRGYHPDLCYLLESRKPLKGPMGDYHSLLAYAAFRCRFSEQQTLSLYCESTYRELGYFDCWDNARDALLANFRKHALPLDARFVQWSRNGPFMYSTNHPRIHCVRDVAISILERAGLDAAYRDALPHDNLANGPVFPIYPEIASALGVPGSLLFKRGGQYRFLRLPEFIEESFALYRNREISIHPLYQRALDTALPIVEAMR